MLLSTGLCQTSPSIQHDTSGTLFWNEFSISMTLGERERVPFVRHDYFVQEWEAVGRILVKGFVSVSYFPTFLSKAFLCYCLFGNQVPDSMFVDSFTKYLSPVEEEFIVDIIRKNQLPDDDEFTDFLERFKCRRVVTTENLSQVILEISKQEHDELCPKKKFSAGAVS